MVSRPRAICSNLVCCLGLAGLLGPASAATVESFLSLLSDSKNDVVLRDGSMAATGQVQAYLDLAPATMTSGFTALSSFRGGPLGEENFAVAFSNWNAAHGGLWTLIDGGSLDISIGATAVASVIQVVDDAKKTVRPAGGVNISIVTADYKRAPNGPTVAQLGWVQAVVANFQPGVGPVMQPVVTLDTFSTGGHPGKPTPLPAGPDASSNTTPSNLGQNLKPGWADPLYPFLGKPDVGGVVLHDEASGSFPDASFRAIALLSTITLRTDADGQVTGRDLTVYEGLSWGFDVSVVPEPPVAALMLAGLLLVGPAGMRRPAQGSGRVWAGVVSTLSKA
jgi:hypothetical protein